jgi:hypothetical protein
MKSEREILEALGGFLTETSEHHHYQSGIVLTDGGKYLAEAAECYWLIDLIGSLRPVILANRFAVALLNVDSEAKTGEFSLNDRKNRVLYEREIPFTDFPLGQAMLFCALEGDEVVVMLPWEYQGSA